jgi:hypothetical protein
MHGRHSCDFIALKVGGVGGKDVLLGGVAYIRLPKPRLMHRVLYRLPYIDCLR